MPAQVVTGRISAEFPLPSSGFDIATVTTDYQQLGKEQWRLTVQTETSARTDNTTFLGMYIGRKDRHDWVMTTEYVLRVKSIDGKQDIEKKMNYDFACQCFTGVSKVISMKQLLDSKHLIFPGNKVRVEAEITVKDGYRDMNEILNTF